MFWTDFVIVRLHQSHSWKILSPLHLTYCDLSGAQTSKYESRADCDAAGAVRSGLRREAFIREARAASNIHNDPNAKTIHRLQEVEETDIITSSCGGKS
ncbi:hypothetical protein Q8A67_023345 [Cirrhinus molitorella]|uniref:Uncharacterized protein n=1 Tax=Cirrhinus molitorella TaxID=172907 RepID=A0AA88TE80_9TELE|nr:hypothetical protein Q8A67_023345 [Cirrhinus molitorella]